MPARTSVSAETFYAIAADVDSALIGGVPYQSLRWPLRAVGGVLNARAFHPGRYHHPALIVSTTGDPAAPYPGSLVMHRALHGSRLVTLTHAFRHGVFPMAGS